MSEASTARLLHQWLIARSRARDLPEPVADHGGWRIDTGSAVEPCRYIFAEPSAKIAALAATIADPRIPLKLCAPPAALAALLPRAWNASHTGTVMIAGGLGGSSPALPTGCVLERGASEHSGWVSIRAPDGSPAASGYCGWSGTHFAYDRIVTAEAWRRRGLARAVMHALGAFAAAQSRIGVLVATDAGRELYRTLGWRDVCAYSTAHVDPSQAEPDRARRPIGGLAVKPAQ